MKRKIILIYAVLFLIVLVIGRNEIRTKIKELIDDQILFDEQCAEKIAELEEENASEDISGTDRLKNAAAIFINKGAVVYTGFATFMASICFAAMWGLIFICGLFLPIVIYILYRIFKFCCSGRKKKPEKTSDENKES